MPFIRTFIFLLFLISLSGNVSANQQIQTTKDSISPTTFSVQKKSSAETSKSEEFKNKKIVSLSIVFIIILFILLYFFYENNQLKQKIKRKDTKQKILLNVINAGIDSQEIERKKIASFLHDNVNSLLSSAGLHLNAFTAQHNIKSEEIQKTKNILAEAHDLLRDMSHDLVPTLLVRFGLLYALEDLCEKNSNSKILFEFSSKISNEKRYPEKFEMKLYFIVSELFSNITKHSEASKAKIILSEKDNAFKIRIKDNGRGFKTHKLKDAEGFGLNRIRARIQKYKGTILIISKANEGTVIKIQVPLPG